MGILNPFMEFIATSRNMPQEVGGPFFASVVEDQQTKAAPESVGQEEPNSQSDTSNPTSIPIRPVPSIIQLDLPSSHRDPTSSHDVMGVMCPNQMKGWMFAGVNVTLIEAILSNLDCKILQAGDIIIHQNSPADRMYYMEVGWVLEETRFIQRSSHVEITLEVYEKLAVL
ncbi:hypothetical protein E1301_Tti020734 [Triplophysa tibetana]|uniref:Cyclic nucleotide-binding domain-containing protein n=1 Tax=Triplophysa tibetana TaxID=1572043 RepID=A0A5A9P644_9TELE|nr:hypothetical protein E1301_Tti020734 [Triplophysa tibetana]